MRRSHLDADVVLGALLALMLVGCGARSSLVEPEEDGPCATDDACDDGDPCTRDTCDESGRCAHASPQVTCDDAVDCTVDVCVPGVGCSHAADDAACDDGLECTANRCDRAEGCVVEVDDDACNDASDCTDDRCDLELGCVQEPLDERCDDGLPCTADVCTGSLGCRNDPSDALCDDGLACTIDRCDPATGLCAPEPCDGVCDDGTFCNGVERCDTTLGCTAGPPSCALGLGCETSSCDETQQICAHTLPPGCFAPDVAMLVTDDAGRLWRVAPFESPSEELLVAANAQTFLDIAILDGRWFAHGFELYELEPGTVSPIRSLGPLEGTSLADGPDGQLYAASTIVLRIDPDSGEQIEIGALPYGHASSGDIAFVGERMFVSTDSACGGSLVEFDRATGTGTVLGGDGLGCVYGLAQVGGVLYLINCDGKVGTFDPDTGIATIVATTSVQAYGAATLP